MVSSVSLLVLLAWIGAAGAVWLTRRALLVRTWNEPYCAVAAVAIESDDWGPGPPAHAAYLAALRELLARHRDATGRPAVLTANLVLAVPDVRTMRAAGYGRYAREALDARDDGMLGALRAARARGTLVPQIHGAEHVCGPGLVELARAGDPRVSGFFAGTDGAAWFELDSPLHAHHVDATALPSRPCPEAVLREQIGAAAAIFARAFGGPSLSAVAPCYLWNDTVERLWAGIGVRYVQTAGYRCSGRDAAGAYIQDRPLIRLGDRGQAGLVYLVRNAMYEPIDGRGDADCLAEARRAHVQALPVVISTHRYNYIGAAAERQTSLEGLDRLLSTFERRWPGLRYVASPEIGAWAAGEPDAPVDLGRLGGLRKVRAFLLRLWYRHAKLRLAALATGLILPLGLLVLAGGAAEAAIREPS